MIKPAPTPHHIPAHLWIGPAEKLLKETVLYLQQEFCRHKGCASCPSCKLIEARQFYAVTWLTPEKTGYTLANLEPLKQYSSYALSPGEQMFFILPEADTLTPATANSLLKLLEEPAPGYSFILLASAQGSVLETIRSRCALKSFDTPRDADTFLDLFIKPKCPTELLTFLEKNTLTEVHAYHIAHQALFYITNLIKHSPHQADIISIRDKLNTLIAHPPMPGGTKIYLKQLFIITQQLTSNHP